MALGLKSGEREAWALLFDHNGDRVWRYVARLVGNDAAAVADIVQETFLAAARSARTFDPQRGTLSQWLLGIAHRQTALHRRRRAALADATVDELHCDANDERFDPATLIEQRETAALVRIALTKLPVEYSTLLVGKYLDDCIVEELVQACGGTTESIRSKLARARNEFRAVFERLRHPV